MEAIVKNWIRKCRQVGIAAGLTIGIGACAGDGATVSPAVDELAPAPTLQERVERPDPVVHPRRSGAHVQLVFHGRVDTVAGTMTVRNVEAYQFVPEVRGGEYVTAEQELWCPLRDNATSGEYVRIENIPFSDGDILKEHLDCELPDTGMPDPVFAAGILGAICGEVQVTNLFNSPLSDVYAMLDEVVPDVARGYRYPQGTGAQPVGNLNDDFGLWYYGDLAVGEVQLVRWIFERPDATAFDFTGRVFAFFTEECNGEDTDCNGRIDDGIGCFADGEPCVDGTDCESGICAAGTCGASSFLVDRVVGVGGAGVMEGGNRRLEVRVGAPAPMGDASGGSFSVRLGPLADR